MPKMIERFEMREVDADNLVGQCVALKDGFTLMRSYLRDGREVRTFVYEKRWQEEYQEPLHDPWYSAWDSH